MLFLLQVPSYVSYTWFPTMLSALCLFDFYRFPIYLWHFFFHPQFATLCVFLCFHESLIFGRAFPSAMVEKVASHKAGLAYVIQEFECKLSFLGLAGGQPVEHLEFLPTIDWRKVSFAFLFWACQILCSLCPPTDLSEWLFMTVSFAKFALGWGSDLQRHNRLLALRAPSEPLHSWSFLTSWYRRDQ